MGWSSVRGGAGGGRGCNPVFHGGLIFRKGLIIGGEGNDTPLPSALNDVTFLKILKTLQKYLSF